jgi:drug/metabolite transporter (DMT)-like permease
MTATTQPAAASNASATKPIVAVAWMVGALLSFTTMSVSVRALSDGLHPVEMLFVRSAIGLAVVFPLVWLKARACLFTHHMGRHVLRNVIHFVGQVLWILGITLLPLATVTSIEFTAPLWGMGLACLFLGERMNRGRWVAVALGFIGLLIMVRPGLVPVDKGVFIMLACAFCFGATTAVTKWLTRTDRPLTIVFYMLVMQTFFGGVISIFLWQPIQTQHWPWLFMLALTGLTAHYCLTRAVAAAEASFIMPFEYMKLPLLAVIGFLIYAEPFEPMILLGALLIFIGNSYSLRLESRRRRAAG